TDEYGFKYIDKLNKIELEELKKFIKVYFDPGKKEILYGVSKDQFNLNLEFPEEIVDEDTAQEINKNIAQKINKNKKITNFRYTLGQRLHETQKKEQNEIMNDFKENSN